MKQNKRFKNLPKILSQRFRKLRLEKEQELAKQIVSPHRKAKPSDSSRRRRMGSAFLADQRGAHGRT
ncbi:MAG: hypothetical protein OJF52_003305 [Nitrospira sp.]|nr:MAG: hypothetical protein OJF52_003305 [Nitrospira sp.]